MDDEGDEPMPGDAGLPANLGSLVPKPIWLGIPLPLANWGGHLLLVLGGVLTAAPKMGDGLSNPGGVIIPILPVMGDDYLG